ncbi:MAG TPA: ATP-binding cassette domain-containing protein, partial [Lachnospiraceae bacterium]|nr:ATP-binding cassette domain-containing protein [Lachnospiraceae bacterium]
PKECRLRNFLSSRPSDAKERRMQEAAKAVKSRIDQLEVKQKPKEIPMIRINFLLTNPPENRFVMEGSNLSFSYGRRMIFKEANFRYQNGKHIAVIGDNGVGKTTLLNLITQNEMGIRIVPKARLAYFRQDYSDLDLSATVIENVRKDSIQKEEVDRSVLARLLFSSDMLLKRAEVLSGGERIKLALAKLFVSNANVLILDEPTNFLDMPSIEALQRMLIDYEGTVIFVSHDRRFVKEVATQICILKDKKLQLYDGTFDEYLASESKKSNHVEATNSSKEILTMRNREAYLLAAQMKLALLVERFSDPKEDKEQLELEYQAALLEMKRLSVPTHKSRGC